jgi:predicted esterase
MAGACRRRNGVWAKVCAWLALSLSSATSHAADVVLELPAQGGELGVVIYPARAPGAHPVTVVLHGMCGEPLRTCRHFAEQVTRDEHLICPRASVRCAGGGASWPQTGFAEPVERAVLRAEAQLGERLERGAGRTLIGYSLGAYRAAQLLEHAGGRYPRAMLIGARVSLDARRLREGGVERLVLSAGAWDMTYLPLQREAARLSRAGFGVRFLGLGPVGHAFTPGFAPYLEQARAWLSGEEPLS